MENVYCGDKDDAPSECLRCKETVTTAGGARHIRCEILWNGRPLPRHSTLSNERGGGNNQQQQQESRDNSSDSTAKEQSSEHASCRIQVVQAIHHGDNNPIAFDQWMAHADQFWGIPLHPLGEINALDFLIINSTTQEEFSRFNGYRLQIVMLTVVFLLEIRNLGLALMMAMSRPKALVSWCCLVPSIFNASTTTICHLLTLGYYSNCRQVIWLVLVLTSISNICNSTMLLQKAYIALQKKKWMIYAGIIPILSFLSYPVVLISTSFIIITPDGGCVIYYPYYSIWLFIAITLPLSTALSSVFCYVAVKQYLQYESEAWKRLAQEGLYAMCSAALCNAICGIIIATQAIGSISDTCSVVACVIINTVLINHCYSMRKIKDLSNQLDTSHIFYPIEIKTSTPIDD
ncbi:hypothetical protein BDF22DRAFT_774916, partial [Syncephalis plumigaleata]